LRCLAAIHARTSFAAGATLRTNFGISGRCDLEIPATASGAYLWPSVTLSLGLKPGVTRFEFSGRHGVDWRVYNVAFEPQAAMIDQWSVTPWGGFVTDKEESQHILRVRGAGQFALVILPWRTREKPSVLSVTREGDAIVVATGRTVIRITPTGYSSMTTGGTLTRRFE
jgi:hypothetical protein